MTQQTAMLLTVGKILNLLEAIRVTTIRSKTGGKISLGIPYFIFWQSSLLQTIAFLQRVPKAKFCNADHFSHRHNAAMGVTFPSLTL
jgi:hypothetical protein